MNDFYLDEYEKELEELEKNCPAILSPLNINPIYHSIFEELMNEKEFINQFKIDKKYLGFEPNTTYIKIDKKYLGFEPNTTYIKIAEKRIEKFNLDK